MRLLSRFSTPPLSFIAFCFFAVMKCVGLPDWSPFLISWPTLHSSVMSTECHAPIQSEVSSRLRVASSTRCALQVRHRPPQALEPFLLLFHLLLQLLVLLAQEFQLALELRSVREGYHASDLPPDNWSGVNDTLRPILGKGERCGRVGFRRSRSLGC